VPTVLAVIFAFAALVLALLGGIAVAVLRVLRGKGGQAAADTEEARLIQQLHADLKRMDRRIEALETILLESRGRDREDAR
jgi:phage shock protein B